METHRVHTWLSRNVFIPWVIHGPWTKSRRQYRKALAEARAGFSHWERCDAEERARWVLKELRSLVRWAGEKVPYYRELFRRVGFDPRADFSFTDYRQLPLLERETVRERVDDLIAEGFSRQNMTQNSTGGSTGTPLRFWLDECSRAWRDAASDWAFSNVGCHPGARIALIWGSNADSQNPQSIRASLLNWLANSQIHNCYRSSLSDEILDRFDAGISAYQPDFLWCYTSALALLAQRLRRRGKRPSYPRVGIITGAEKLDLRQRKLIEDVFSVPVYESYGSRDCSLIGMQLSYPDRHLHVAGANLLVEPYGAPDPSSGNEILVTDLHRLGMPFLRYRIGDRARFPSTVPDQPIGYLEEVTGRAVDQVLLPGGRIVLGVQFSGLLRKFDVCEYQVVQEATGEVRVLLVPGSKLSSSDLEKMERSLKENLKGVSLSISLVSSIERTHAGKLRPVISHYRPGDSIA